MVTVRAPSSSATSPTKIAPYRPVRIPIDRNCSPKGAKASSPKPMLMGIDTTAATRPPVRSPRRLLFQLPGKTENADSPARGAGCSARMINALFLHPQNSSDVRDVRARLQAVGDDRFQPVLDGLAQAVQSFPHPVMAAYRRIEDVLEGLHLVPQQLHVARPALDFCEIAFQSVDELRHFFQIDFLRPFVPC